VPLNEPFLREFAPPSPLTSRAALRPTSQVDKKKSSTIIRLTGDEMDEDSKKYDFSDEASLDVVQAVDETIKYLSGRLGIILLESRKNHSVVAALPFYLNEDGGRTVKFIINKDKVARNAIVSVLNSFEQLAGQNITLMTYEEGVEIIRENVELHEDEGEE
jgi:hypothetical protein